MAFRVAAAQCKKICPERLNWPGRLAGISEGHRGISKYFFLDHFSPSFLCQKWCQIFVRIFCVLSGARNPTAVTYFTSVLGDNCEKDRPCWIEMCKPE